MFYVVQLDSHVLKEKIVVPSLWLDKANTLCLLPPTYDTAEIETLAKAQTTPKSGWKMYNLSFIQSFDTYSQAEDNIKKTKSKPLMVELDKEEEEKGKKRKRKRTSFFGNCTPETDDDEENNSALKEFCFVEGNLNCIDTSVVKVEVPALSSSSECKRQPQDTIENICPSNCNVLHETDVLVTENSSSKVKPPQFPINTKCPCNSSCHKLLFQSLTVLQKQTEDSNHMLYQIMTQLKSTAPILNTISGSPIDFPISLPIKELGELQRFNNYLSNPRNFTEAIPYFTGLGGSQPRQILKRIMEALLTEELSAKMNWKGRGDKDPFNNYIRIHSFVHHVAKQNPRANHITLTEVENFMKDWLKMAPLKYLKSGQKKEQNQEEKVLQC